MNTILHRRSRMTTNHATQNATTRRNLRKRLDHNRLELLTMATTHALSSSHILTGDDAADTAPAAIASRRRRTLLRRVYDAILESQMRRAHREIARVLGPRALSEAFRAPLPPEA
jgi:hypothetical protein